MFALHGEGHQSHFLRRTVPSLFSAALLVFLVAGLASAQPQPVGGDEANARQSKRVTLWQLEQELRAKGIADREEAIRFAERHGLPVRKEIPDGRVIDIQAVRRGLPRYHITHNADAADTVGADELQPGGSTGYGLTGAGITLGIWDGGPVRTTHREFGGRVTSKDGSPSSGYHATHVGGTMIATGIDADAKGMSFTASLSSYDWNYDEAEMATEALLGLQLSNHSYGYVTGWTYYGGEPGWYWYGDTSVSTTEDYRFGFYDSQAQDWDAIAYNALDYLIVKSAGNDRNDTGPAPGAQHWVWDPFLGWVLSTDVRDPDGDYDCIEGAGVSKNLLSVGAVNDIIGGYTTPSGVVMSIFSSWGPADDGRIKPDIVANGVSLYSCAYYADDAYWSMSGTSMSSPNTTGTLGLLLEQYKAKRFATPRSATLKALVIHTANEAGSNPGPDYAFGWGLLNAAGAAETIVQANTGEAVVSEETLSDGSSFTLDVDATGAAPLKVTIVWTDPPGTPVAPAVDPTDKMLVNDLDLRITREATTYSPWVLDPASPAAAATTGDNDTDNVEQVVVDSPVAGAYQITVDHKGALSGGSQEFTIIVTGIQLPTYTLTVESDPTTGIGIAGTHSGVTNYTANVPVDSTVTLVAAGRSGRLYFSRWKDISDATLTGGQTYSFTMSSDTTVIAEYTFRRVSGFVWGWGLNVWGQVGDGSTTNRLVPVILEAVLDVSQVVGGKYHSLALTGGGEVWAWGGNEYGQIGDGATGGDHDEPTQLVGLTDVAHVAAGARHSLAATKTDGTVWAWGDNNSGQLGDGTTAASATPVQVIGLADVIAVAAGAYHSVALKSDGTVWAWGSNAWGQLGDDRGGLTMDTYMGSLTPVQVAFTGSVNIVELAAGACHTLALADDGTVYAWGGNTWGQLGNGRTDDAWLPVEVSGLTDAAQIGAGSWHSLAVLSTGSVRAWGANWWGQLGDGTYFSRSRPTLWAVMSGVVQVAGGENHSVALDSDGSAWAWGWNRHGQHGVGNTITHTTPTLLSTLENVDQVAAGASHSLAVAPIPYEPPEPPARAGTIRTTGDNEYGQLGAGDTSDRDSFTELDLVNVLMIDGGDEHSIALERDGAIWTCGSNEYGQLGQGGGGDLSVFTEVEDLTDVIAVSAGADHVMALKSDGTVWVCGQNGETMPTLAGALGLGDTTDRNEFTQVPGLDRVTAIAGGGNHSIVLKDDGMILTTGYNEYGQLGLGDDTNRTSFTLVPDVENVIAISAGAYHTVLLKVDGTVWVTGRNDTGQTGQGGESERNTFIQVSGLSDIAAISAGGHHTLALTDEGDVWGCGRNTDGELGLGDNSTRTSFVEITALSNVTAINAGIGSHSLVLKDDRSLWTTGRNGDGQLGLGDTTNRNTFEQVTDLEDVIWVAAGENHSYALTFTPGEWTFMVYLDADNNLEQDGIYDFLEMASVGSTPEVNIVVLFDRTPGYDSTYDNWTDTRRGLVQSGDLPNTDWGESVGEKNMGDPDTLEEFVLWAMDYYPAERYAIILWNHGDGWYDAYYSALQEAAGQDRPGLKEKAETAPGIAGVLGGPDGRNLVPDSVCIDDSSGYDALSLAELRSALEHIEDDEAQPNLIGFDACLMAMAEVAYEMRERGEVMVGSEETEPGPGWPYDTILDDLVNTPTMTAAELGTAIVNDYYDSYAPFHYTQSAVDLSEMDSLAGEISTFAQTLMDEWDGDTDAVMSAAQDVLDQLDVTIIHEQHGSEYWPGSHGMAIYFPEASIFHDSDYDGGAGVLQFTDDTQWDEFLDEFYDAMDSSWVGYARYMSQVFAIPEHVDLYDFCDRIANYAAPLEYYTESQITNEFVGEGSARGWYGDDVMWQYTLPFTFPFFGVNRDTIWISSNGYIDFSGLGWSEFFGTTGGLVRNERIAPLWTDLFTYEVYIHEPTEDSVCIRWEADEWWDYDLVNVEVVLYKDGRVKYNYGSGNTTIGENWTGPPTIGLSKGDSSYFQLSVYHKQATLTNVQTDLWTPVTTSTTTTSSSTTTSTTTTTTTTLSGGAVPPISASDVPGVGDAWDFSDLLEPGDGIIVMGPSGPSDEPPVVGEPTEKAQPVATEQDAIVDNRDNSAKKRFKRLSGEWPLSRLAGGYYGRDYVYARARSGEENSRAQFRCTTLVAGRYDVYTWWSSRTDRATNVAYEVHHADGVTTVRADQTQNGGRWNLLGAYDFAAGTHAVEIHNGLSTPGSFVCADAVRFARTGDPTGEAPMIASPQSSAVRTTYAVEARSPSVQTTSAMPGLTLLAPNKAGLEIRPGRRFAALWRSSGLPSFTPVEIALYRGGEKIRTLTVTPNDGHWTWRVGYDQRGDAYTIRITALGCSPKIFGESDHAFVIALPGEW